MQCRLLQIKKEYAFKYGYSYITIYKVCIKHILTVYRTLKNNLTVMTSNAKRSTFYIDMYLFFKYILICTFANITIVVLLCMHYFV